jgi:hypothetical protein
MGGMTMTTQSALILTGIVSIFAIFGIALAWTDFYTQRGPKPANDERSAAPANRPDAFDQRRAA